MFRPAALVLLLVARVAVAAPLFDDAWPAAVFLPRTTPLAAGFFSPLVNRVVKQAERTDNSFAALFEELETLLGAALW